MRTPVVWPERPRRRGVAFVRRLRHDLDLRHARRALADRRADTVAASVASADDEDLLPLRADRRLRDFSRKKTVLPFEKLEREMDAAEFASGNPEVARCWRSDRDDNRIVLLLQPLRGDVLPDLAVRDEPNSQHGIP